MATETYQFEWYTVHDMISASPTRDKLNKFGRVSSCDIQVGVVKRGTHNATLQLA